MEIITIIDMTIGEVVPPIEPGCGLPFFNNDKAGRLTAIGSCKAMNREFNTNDYEVRRVYICDIGGIETKQNLGDHPDPDGIRDQEKEDAEIDLQTENKVIEQMRDETEEEIDPDARQDGLEMGLNQKPASREDI